MNKLDHFLHTHAQDFKRAHQFGITKQEAEWQQNTLGLYALLYAEAQLKEADHDSPHTQAVLYLLEQARICVQNPHSWIVGLWPKSEVISKHAIFVSYLDKEQRQFFAMSKKNGNRYRLKFNAHSNPLTKHQWFSIFSLHPHTTSACLVIDCIALAKYTSDLIAHYTTSPHQLVTSTTICP